MEKLAVGTSTAAAAANSPLLTPQHPTNPHPQPLLTSACSIVVLLCVIMRMCHISNMNTATLVGRATATANVCTTQQQHQQQQQVRKVVH